MYSACYPKTARRQGNRIIHAQRSNGGASAWCQSKDSCTILAPLKVFVPPLTTWIKESHLTARFRVARMTLLSLELITEWAAQAQVLKLGRSTCRLRDDMVNVETRQGQLLRGQGVLTPIVRGTDNLLPECLRNTGHNGHGLAFCRSRAPGQFQNVSGARLFDQPCAVFIDQLLEPFALGRA